MIGVGNASQSQRGLMTVQDKIKVDTIGNRPSGETDTAWDKITILSNNVDDLSVDYIVEQGSNVNGNYRKWNSGTMECWGHNFATTITLVPFVFPKEFVSTPEVIMSAGAGGGRFPFYVEDVNSTGFNAYVNRGSSTATIHLRYFAIGRWK